MIAADVGNLDISGVWGEAFSVAKTIALEISIPICAKYMIFKCGDFGSTSCFDGSLLKQFYHIVGYIGLTHF